MDSNNPFNDADDAQQFAVEDEAQREAVPALVSLWGFSDSGKTYSALRLARGLVGPKGKIGIIDTENKRAKHYAGKFGGFSHLDLQPPFTPQRYTAAFDTLVARGVNCVIVDSMSHVWEGEGGVLEQADNNTTNGLGKWKGPKTAYIRMVNKLLRSPVHAIFCLRAKDKYVQIGQGKKAEIQFLGQEPICGKRFVYEMTVNAHMESGTRVPLSPVKIPDGMVAAIKPGEFITEAMGAEVAGWLAGGIKVDHAAQALQQTARDEAVKGREHFLAWYKAVDKGKRITLQHIIPELQALAAHADEESMAVAMQASESANSGTDALEDAFTNRTAA